MTMPESPENASRYRHGGDAVDLERYFARIGYEGPGGGTIEEVGRITWLHQQAIPFENLDIALFRRPIALDPASLVAKLVERRRGGFCFEQNGLLAAVLEALGWEVTMGYATWLTEEGTRIDPFDHLVLAITRSEEETPWLADVGFGRQTPARPVPLAPDRTIVHPETGYAYRALFLEDPGLQWAVQVDTGEGWGQLYDLDLRPRAMPDYEHRSLFHQTSSESHFANGFLCSRMLPGGRVTIADGRLILTRNGRREEHPLPDRAAELEALRDWFGLDIAEEEIP
jgi:arylamine N-acetyltransferase